jgi:ABC-type transporter Mla MlaB component
MGEIKYKINQPKRGEKNLKIFLGGDMGVNNLDEITGKIKDVEKDFTEFEIVLSEVTNFDIASIQLLKSLKKTFERNKKKYKIKIELPKDTWELIESTGFSKELKNL